MAVGRPRKTRAPVLRVVEIEAETERRERLYARLEARMTELRDFFVAQGVALPPPEHAHRSRLGREALRVGAHDEAWTRAARRFEAERLAALGRTADPPSPAA